MHAYLYCIGIGTYDLIVENRELKQLKLKLKLGDLSKETYQEECKKIRDKRGIAINERKKSRVIREYLG